MKFTAEFFHRYSKPKTEKDKLESYKIILDAATSLIPITHNGIKNSERTAYFNDALILYQMSVAKGMFIYNAAKGIPYSNELIDGVIKADYVHYDSTIISAITRTQFEAFANFHNIYLSSDDPIARNYSVRCVGLGGAKSKTEI